MENISGKIGQEPSNSLVFETADGRKTELQIVSREIINSGVALTERIVVAVLNESGKSRKRNFVLKTYRDRNLAEHSLAIHKKLKDVGIMTWPTYRIEANDRNSIIMTDGELSDKDKIITPNNLSQSAIEIAGRVNLITEFEDVVGFAIQDAIKAGCNGIQLGSDAWMGKFTIESASNDARLRFFIGDLECVNDSQIENEKNLTTKLSQLNLLTLEKALSNIIQWSVSGESLLQYQKILRDKFSQLETVDQFC